MITCSQYFRLLNTFSEAISTQLPPGVGTQYLAGSIPLCQNDALVTAQCLFTWTPKTFYLYEYIGPDPWPWLSPLCITPAAKRALKAALKGQLAIPPM